MPPSRYARGRAVEYRTVEALRALGYRAQRAASSKGDYDVYAIRDDEVLLVSCKRAGEPKGARAAYTRERKRLVALAATLPPAHVAQALWIWADTLPDAPRGGWYCMEHIP